MPVIGDIRHSRVGGIQRARLPLGTNATRGTWVPACAGMTSWEITNQAHAQERRRHTHSVKQSQTVHGVSRNDGR